MNARWKDVRKDWTTEAGLRAVVLMGDMGYHCGYVGVPAGHVLHGVDYSTPCAALTALDSDTPLGKRSVMVLFSAAVDSARMQSPELVFDVHGGITYSGGSADYPAPNDGLWWFGYDCGHAGDAPNPSYADGKPAHIRHLYAGCEGDVFRDEAYCIAECESLAKQIVDATQGAAS